MWRCRAILAVDGDDGHTDLDLARAIRVAAGRHFCHVPTRVHQPERFLEDRINFLSIIVLRTHCHQPFLGLLLPHHVLVRLLSLSLSFSLCRLGPCRCVSDHLAVGRAAAARTTARVARVDAQDEDYLRVGPYETNRLLLRRPGHVRAVDRNNPGPDGHVGVHRIGNEDAVAWLVAAGAEQPDAEYTGGPSFESRLGQLLST